MPQHQSRALTVTAINKTNNRIAEQTCTFIFDGGVDQQTVEAKLVG